MSNEERLLAEVQAAVEGPPPAEGVWQKLAFARYAKRFAGGSVNLPALSTAVAAALNPVAAAEWWQDTLLQDWNGLWDAQECGGRTYGGWTWEGELAALRVFRERLPGQPVIGLLERSLTRRAAWYALTGVSEVVKLGARGQETYRGLGSLTTGGRSNHFEEHAADHVLHRVLIGSRPWVERQPNPATRLADAIMRTGGPAWTGVHESSLERLRKLVSGEGSDEEAVRFAVSLLGPTRTMAPLWVRRYQDGTLACGVEWNPSSNTSCAFLVASMTNERPLRLRDQVVFLHPYGPHLRVRDTGRAGSLGKRILGPGETWWEGSGDLDVFGCANLTREDAARREGGERWELRHRFPPASTLAWELRTSPHADPRLTVDGAVQPRPPAPPEPPEPEPEPKEPPMPPPPSDEPGIPEDGHHVAFRLREQQISGVAKLWPDKTWTWIRWKRDGDKEWTKADKE